MVTMVWGGAGGGEVAEHSSNIHGRISFAVSVFTNRKLL